MNAVDLVNLGIVVIMGVSVSMLVNYIYSSLKKDSKNGFLHFNI
jgi:hypothetical protein